MEVIIDLIRTLVAPAAQVLLALTGAYLLTLWIVLIIWTFRDIEARSRSVITQVFATLLVVFFFLPGVLLYLILRPKETLDETFQRALQEEYLLQDLEELPLCQTCRHYVQGDFVLCPQCHTRLRENCPNCARLVELRWSVCPYCTMPLPDGDESEVEPEAETVPPLQLPEWVNPALEQLRVRVLKLRENMAARDEDDTYRHRRLSERAGMQDAPPSPEARNGHHRDVPLPPHARNGDDTENIPADEAAAETGRDTPPDDRVSADEEAAPETAGTGRRRRK